MHAALLKLAQATPEQLARAQHTVLLTLSLSLLVLVFVCTALILALWRSRKTPKRPPPAPPPRSAWEEAGRRAAPAQHADIAAQAGMPSIDASVRDRPIAVITGAARRVGREIALELARAGCNIFFTYRSSDADAAKLGGEIAGLGVQATMFHLDLADAASVEEFVKQTRIIAPRIDVLVHNASVYDPTPLGEVTLEDISRQYVVNAGAPLLITARLRAQLEGSILPGGACVVAITDSQTLGTPRRNYGAYMMSKSALNQMVQSLAREMAPRVRVNAVAPGVVAWPETGEESLPETQAKLLKRVPLGRTGEPSDVAKAVRWLAFEAKYATGEILRLDGGWSLT